MYAQLRSIHIEKSIVMYQYNNYNTYELKGLTIKSHIHIIKGPHGITGTPSKNLGIISTS
jgi:hypothetical protein